MISMLYEAFLDAVAVVSPIDCAGCQKPDRALCVQCRTELVAQPHYQSLADGTSVVSALRYEKRVRAVLLAFKEQGRTDVARSLSCALRAATESCVLSAQTLVEVCPIPSTSQAMRRRGYRPVEFLLSRAGLRASRVLVLSRGTAQQKFLGRAARAGNLCGSFQAKYSLNGRCFVVVDDIVTTGSTLGEAARAIRAAGGEVVAAATLAFTPMRNLITSVRDLHSYGGYGG